MIQLKNVFGALGRQSSIRRKAPNKILSICHMQSYSSQIISRPLPFAQLDHTMLPLNQGWYGSPSIQQYGLFSTKAEAKESKDEDETSQKVESKKSLRETINEMQGKQSNDSTTEAENQSDDTKDNLLDSVSGAFKSFSSAVGETWNELLESGQHKDINKKLSDIHKTSPGGAADDDNEAADKYEGTTAIMVIDESENLNAFERIQKRLSEAPIIQDILGRTQEIYEKSGASKAHEKISNISEDAREAWETSQNPWVYRVSSVYDTVTAESESAMAERELRELDPHFSLEQWKHDVESYTLPKIMRLFLEGRIKDLEPFLGEAVYNKVAAEARARKKEGVYVDSNVLGIMNAEILSCNPDTVNKGSPIIVLHFMCQQINCVRKKEDGTITEGSEDDIRAYSYVAAFQREYDEEKGELNWKIVDFMLNGAIAYL